MTSEGSSQPQRAPWGHSQVAHRLFGFCAHCPDRDALAEVIAWRSWAVQRGVMAWPTTAAP